MYKCMESSNNYSSDHSLAEGRDETLKRHKEINGEIL